MNKTSTKVFLVFDIQRSLLPEFEKQRLLRKFPSGFIQVANQETRSQFRNTALAFQQLQELIEMNLKITLPRKKKLSPHLTTYGKKKKVSQAHLQQYRKRYFDSRNP